MYEKVFWLSVRNAMKSKCVKREVLTFAIMMTSQRLTNVLMGANKAREQIEHFFKGDLNGTTLSQATSLQQAYDTNCFV